MLPYVNCHPKFPDARIMPYGKLRRKIIMECFNEIGEFAQLVINKKHCIVLRNDPDFRYLVKKGLLVIAREGFKGCRNSYLRLPKA